MAGGSPLAVLPRRAGAFGVLSLALAGIMWRYGWHRTSASAFPTQSFSDSIQQRDASAWPVDKASRLYVIPRFLSEDEVSAFRSLGNSYPSYFETAPPLHYASADMPRSWESGYDELTRVVEERIAHITGIATHAHDSSLQVAIGRPWNASLGHAFNLHHDTNKAPRRAATVLIYLSDAENDGLEGGETIFPCLELREPSTTVAPDLCTLLGDAFASGERFLRVTSASQDRPAFDETAVAAVNEACAEPSASGSGSRVATRLLAGGLRIRPERGAALLFFSRGPGEGAPLIPETWHGGCRVRRGEKWTMQLFKEVPETVLLMDGS
jgi:hypothetical protein